MVGNEMAYVREGKPLSSYLLVQQADATQGIDDVVASTTY